MGLFGTSWNTKFNKQTEYEREQLKNQQDFTERMWNQTNDWNLAQWNRENEYNTPEAQMQRFMDAGINPNSAAEAIAGNDSASGSVSASLPSSPSTPASPNPTGTDVVGNVSGLASMLMGIGRYVDTERNQIQAQTENVKQNTEQIAVDMKKTQEEITDLIFKNDHLNYDQQRLLISTYEKNMAEKSLTEYERDEIKEKILNLGKEREMIDSQKRQIDAQIENMREQINLLKEQVRTEVTEQARNMAQVALDKAQAGLASMQAKKADLEAEYQDMVNDYEAYLQGIGTSTKSGGSASDALKAGAAAGSMLGNAGRAVVGKEPKRNPVRALGRAGRARYRSNNHRNP